MPSAQLLKYIGIGLLLVAEGILAVFHMQRGAHIELKGEVLKVRSIPTGEASSVVIVDFRFVNPSDYPFVVRRVDASLEDQEGRVFEGDPISDVDAKGLFEYYPALGQKYNDSLVIRTKVGPKQSLDRMLAVPFDVPQREIEKRKKLQIRVEDVDGAVSEIVEERKQ